jgi:Rieske Fe-S protein
METAPRHPRHHPSRRRVLRRVGGLIASLPFVAAFVSLVRRSDAGRPPRQVRFTPDFRDGFAFSGEVVVRLGEGGHLTAFSTQCTHLGCRISRVDSGLLVCPCHGSRFRPDGTVAAGPASRPLTVLPFTMDPATGAIVVNVG